MTKPWCWLFHRRWHAKKDLIGWCPKCGRIWPTD